MEKPHFRKIALLIHYNNLSKLLSNLTCDPSVTGCSLLKKVSDAVCELFYQMIRLDHLDLRFFYWHTWLLTISLVTEANLAPFVHTALLKWRQFWIFAELSPLQAKLTWVHIKNNVVTLVTFTHIIEYVFLG